jgi:hypothetical protein
MAASKHGIPEVGDYWWGFDAHAGSSLEYTKLTSTKQKMKRTKKTDRQYPEFQEGNCDLHGTKWTGPSKCPTCQDVEDLRAAAEKLGYGIIPLHNA